MNKYIIAFFTVVFLAGISSCVKEKYTTPPVVNADPDIAVNYSISAIKALYANGPTQISQDYVISAIVTGDDRSGNLYKELIIQDSTGGITLTINGSDLYTTYPVGRRLFIKLRNLYVAQYEGNYELIGYVNSDGSYSGIATANENLLIFPGKWGIPVVPVVTTIPQFTTNLNTYQSELIELDNVQFQPGSSAGQPYADPVTLSSGSLTLEDCSHNTAVVYTSGYANFAGSKAPTGNGKLLCIYGVYRGAPQLTIRDTTDIFLTGTPCP